MRVKLITLLVFFVQQLNAVQLPAILGDNMVLQQKSKVQFWGWGYPMEKIRIKSGWSNAVDSITVPGNGRWSCYIQTPAAGGPHTIEIKGHNIITLTNILIGEIWICSGQSNMDMSFGALNYSHELASSGNNSIRLLQVPKVTSKYPQEDIKAKWEVAAPTTVKNFSAVGYFFASKLQKELNVPIGIINSSWGGSPGEVWLSAEDISKDSVLQLASSKLNANKYASTIPGDNFNAMIYPLLNYSIAGVLWYQGESNVGQASYGKLLKTLISSWRKSWKTDLPFYYVQIAPWSGYGKSISAALLREEQTRVLEVPRTGMVITSDLVDDITDLHPKMKKEVGIRLGELALANNYGFKNIFSKIPLFEKLQIKGDKAYITIKNAESGLVIRSSSLSGLYIADNNKIFFPAHIQIKKNQIIAWNENVKNPVAVRYAFTGDATASLFTKEGLPVNLFRTDNWSNSTISQ